MDFLILLAKSFRPYNISESSVFAYFLFAITSQFYERAYVKMHYQNYEFIIIRGFVIH